MKKLYIQFVLVAILGFPQLLLAQDCTTSRECYQLAVSKGASMEAIRYFDKAEALWVEADGKDKKNMVFNARGNVYFRLKEYPKAIQNYNKIIQSKPASTSSLANAYLSRGNVMAANGNANGSIASYTKADEILNPHLTAIQSRALEYKKQGNIDACIADLKRAAALGSQNAISQLYYDYETDYREDQKTALASDEQWQKIEQLKSEGESLIIDKKYDDAIAKFVAAETIFQSRGDVENINIVIVPQSRIFRLQERFDEAISNASRAVYSSYPTFWAYIELGLGKYSKGDEVGGIEVCKMGLERFKGNQDIKNTVSWMYSNTARRFWIAGDNTTAYNLYFTAYRENAKDVDAIKNAGHTAYAAKMYKEALNAYLIALGMDASLKGELEQYITYLQSIVD